MDFLNAATLDVGPNLRFIAIILIQAVTAYWAHTAHKVKGDVAQTQQTVADTQQQVKETKQTVVDIAHNMGVEVTPPSGTPTTPPTTP